MKARAHDPLRLDVAAFAAEGARLAGSWSGAELTRLAGSQSLPQDTPAAPVSWRCAGECRPVPVGQAEIWLRIVVRTEVWLTCQRCLQPLSCPLEVDRDIRFVRGEAEAEALDAESEHDVLALTRMLDLRELVEDELLLALPLVPRHAACPQPLNWTGAGAGADEAGQAAEAPFAALLGLRGRRGPE